MPPIAYTVRATLPDEPTAREYIAWLKGGHVDAVLRAGARSATIVRLDGPAGPGGGVCVEVRYLFPSREAFDRYEREHAPALRAEGLARFGPGSGRTVSFERSVGQVT